MTLKTIALAYVGAFLLAFYIGSGGAGASPATDGGEWIHAGPALTGTASTGTGSTGTGSTGTGLTGTGVTGSATPTLNRVSLPDER